MKTTISSDAYYAEFVAPARRSKIQADCDATNARMDMERAANLGPGTNGDMMLLHIEAYKHAMSLAAERTMEHALVDAEYSRLIWKGAL